MTSLTLVLLAVSLALLVLGVWCFKITGSRGLIMTTFFGSFGTLFGAFQASHNAQPEWAIVLPFFATMVFGGRAIAMWWRSRKEAELKLPARLLIVASLLALGGTIFAFTTAPGQMAHASPVPTQSPSPK